MREAGAQSGDVGRGKAVDKESGGANHKYLGLESKDLESGEW